MLSVVTTVSDFSLELQRAAYGYRADYYLGGVRGMRQVQWRRPSYLREPANASGACGSSLVSATGVASGMNFIPDRNDDSRFIDSGH